MIAGVRSNTLGKIAGVESRASGDSKGFKEMLTEALDSVNKAQWEADRATTALALGEVQDVHQVTLAMERADLMLQLTIRVRNKAIEAYQEISRMQI